MDPMFNGTVLPYTQGNGHWRKARECFVYRDERGLTNTFMEIRLPKCFSKLHSFNTCYCHVTNTLSHVTSIRLIRKD